VLHPDVHRHQSAVQGRGLAAAKLIPEGTVVCALGDGEHQLALTHRQLRSLPKALHHLAYRRRDQALI
jgi:hypothetical protein